MDTSEQPDTGLKELKMSNAVTNQKSTVAVTPSVRNLDTGRSEDEIKAIYSAYGYSKKS